MKISAIIPGAGSGTRFGSDKNKIFASLRQKPVFLRTLEAFAQRKDICQLIFVVSQADRPEFESQYADQFDKLGVQLVTGGATRTQSVRNALQVVSQNADLVAVHDAARPCIAQNWLDRVFEQAQKHEAALLAYPIFGTVKRVENSLITDTLDRSEYHNLYEAQTPQVFTRELIKRAYDAKKEATDCAALVEMLGKKVAIALGDLRNIKITTQADLKFAEEIFDTIR